MCPSLRPVVIPIVPYCATFSDLLLWSRRLSMLLPSEPSWPEPIDLAPSRRDLQYLSSSTDLQQRHRGNPTLLSTTEASRCCNVRRSDALILRSSHPGDEASDTLRAQTSSNYPADVPVATVSGRRASSPTTSLCTCCPNFQPAAEPMRAIRASR